jgi:hypothetical protein
MSSRGGKPRLRKCPASTKDKPQSGRSPGSRVIIVAPPSRFPSGMQGPNSPVTVAGTAPDFRRLPYYPRSRADLVRGGADRGVLCWVQAARLSDFESAGFFGSREGREGAKYAKIQRWPEGPFHIPLPFKFAGQEFVGATRGFAQSPSRSSLLCALRVK